MENSGTLALRELTELPCACANLRRASRAVTQLYAQEFRATGLEPTQFTSLMALASWGRVNQGELAERLAIDSTTLTRTLAPLRRRGWIRVQPGADRRERLFELTPAGRRKFLQARPHWERTQKRLQSLFTKNDWKQLQRGLVQLAEAAQRA
jgi:DNA-binding MarR family transcriptional regulator